MKTCFKNSEIKVSKLAAFYFIFQFVGCNPLGSSSIEGNFLEGNSSGGGTSSSGSCTAGTASAGDVLAGLTFPDGSGAMTTGTMSNRGSWLLSATTVAATSVTFPGAGYYSGISGTPAGNKICTGTTIVGVDGSATCASGATTGTTIAAQHVCTGYSGHNLAGTAINGIRTCPEVGTPSTISGLAIWLRADAMTGMSDNSAVRVWRDSSGNFLDLEQSTVANRPVYKTNILNGYPVVRFTGASSHYLTSTSTLSGLPQGSAAVTVFVVAKVNDVTVQQEIGGWGANTTDQRWGVGFINGSTISTEIAGSNSSVAAVTSGAWFVYTIAYTAGTAIAHASNLTYLNGTAAAAGAAGAGTPNITNGIFEIGRLPSHAGFFLTGDLAEYIVYDSTLSPANVSLVECYLSSKYAIALGHGC